MTKISGRRYLGNKYKLLPFIKSVILEKYGDFSSFCDIFAGTGAVSSAFLDKNLITNDILYSNYLCHIAWFSNENFDMQKLQAYIDFFNSDLPFEENYMTANFSDTYFSKSVCSKIGFVREFIEKEFERRKINEKERAMLVTSLLYALDKIAATCGHYDAYRKGAKLCENLALQAIEPNFDLRKNFCFNRDANELAREISADMIYLDPPYNSRQYCDAYHLLENIARWKKPQVFGVARKMERADIKSGYCTKDAPAAFADLIENLQAKFLVVSYNNMAKKGNERSNARISDGEIVACLEKKGEVEVFSERHKAFSAGKSSRADNEERLFVCRVK